MAKNPRQANGNARRKLRSRLKAEGRGCWICEAFGRNPTIDYSLPAGHPGAFEVDELVPVSRYWLGGYQSAEQCALDYKNLASVHRACNQWRGNKSVEHVLAIARGEAPMKRGSYATNRGTRGRFAQHVARRKPIVHDPIDGTF